MKAPNFEYAKPDSLAKALVLMSDQERDVMALAGGQSLMPMMNFRLATPDVLVDLGGVSELTGIVEGPEMVQIGAMTKYAEIAAYDNLNEHLPLVAKALPQIAHSAIRNRGTIGGSVSLADPAAEMPAVLIALGATIHLASTKGTKSITAENFFRGLYETERAPDELVTLIEILKAGPDDKFGFYELTRRHGDYAMAGVSIAFGQSLRVVFFSVSDRPVRARSAEELLSGNQGAIDEAVASLSEIEFIGDLNGDAKTKQHLAGVALRRAWAEIGS